MVPSFPNPGTQFGAVGGNRSGRKKGPTWAPLVREAVDAVVVDQGGSCPSCGQELLQGVDARSVGRRIVDHIARIAEGKDIDKGNSVAAFTALHRVSGERVEDIIAAALADEPADVHRIEVIEKVEPPTLIEPSVSPSEATDEEEGSSSTLEAGEAQSDGESGEPAS